MSVDATEKDDNCYWIVVELEYEEFPDGTFYLGDYELYDGEECKYDGDYCRECALKVVDALDKANPGTHFGARYDTCPVYSSYCCECEMALNEDCEEEA